METPAALLPLVPLAPLLAACAAGVLALTRKGERAAPWLTIAGTLAAAFVAAANFPPSDGAIAVRAAWVDLGPRFVISFGVHLDRLAWLMVAVVTSVSALVQLYSTAYMRGEDGFARYFAYLALFTASMLGLVVADNLFQLYVCWELVGICSYLLIGFWWHKPSAANAAKKAFVVTRFGDVGFMLGVLLLASVAGSFDFGEVERAVRAVAHGERAAIPLVGAHTFVWLAPLLLFCGAVGKSAQFPLHVWLPDAMEGPTPVSALIHAATMVAAGVYMVARLLPLFSGSGAAMDSVMLIGSVTALIAATIAVVQVDIKKVMAYSTISQLGYMMLGLGAGGRLAGMFHLTTHAMFKALLFLAAGSVIHALHHSSEPNDLRRMGGLLRRMPITAWTCLAGTLALAGFPGLSGFWSKDAVLGAALQASAANPVAMLALATGVVVAAITAFYAGRMWLMAFWGEPRTDDAAHAHESPWQMALPLVLLAVPSVVLGYALHSGHAFASFMGSAEHDATHLGLVVVTTVAALGGLAGAWTLYGRRAVAADPVERMPGHAFLANLWHIDTFWTLVGARGSTALGRACAWVDRNVIDRYVANGPGWLCVQAAHRLRRTTSGQAQSYAAALLAAVVLMTVLLVWYEGRLRAQPPRLVMRAPVVLTAPIEPSVAGAVDWEGRP